MPEQEILVTLPIRTNELSDILANKQIFAFTADCVFVDINKSRIELSKKNLKTFSNIFDNIFPNTTYYRTQEGKTPEERLYLFKAKSNEEILALKDLEEFDRYRKGLHMAEQSVHNWRRYPFSTKLGATVFSRYDIDGKPLLIVNFVKFYYRDRQDNGYSLDNLVRNANNSPRILETDTGVAKVVNVSDIKISKEYSARELMHKLIIK